MLHREQFVGGKTARLAAIEYTPTAEQPDTTYPMLLTTGRTLYHFNAGTMSYRTSSAALRPSDTLDVAPADAARWGVLEGEMVRVSSRYGTTTLPVHISPAMQAGQLFSTFHRPDLFVNRLTSPVRDRLADTPEYKVTAVRVEKLIGEAHP